MVRSYTRKNDYVIRARPEITEEVVAALVKGTYEMIPASSLEKEIGVSRVTIGKYYRALSERMKSRVWASLGSASSLRGASEVWEDQQFGASLIEISDWHADFFPTLMENAFDAVVEAAYVRLYRDKKMRTLQIPADEINNVSEREIARIPRRIRTIIVKAALDRARKHLKSRSEQSLFTSSDAEKKILTVAGILLELFISGFASYVTKSFFWNHSYFYARSKEHRALSLNMFKHAFTLLIIFTESTSELEEWRDPNRLILDLKLHPLKFSRTS